MSVLLAARDAERGLWLWPMGAPRPRSWPWCGYRSGLPGPGGSLQFLVVRRRKTHAVGEVVLLLVGFALAMAPWWVR